MTELELRGILLLAVVIIAALTRHQVLKRTGGKYPLARGQGSWHQPPGWWWDKDAARWRPEKVPRSEAPTAADIAAEQSQGVLSFRPAWSGSWAAYQRYIRSLPWWRLASTTGVIALGDAASLLWPNLRYRGMFIGIAAVMSTIAIIPLVARWGPLKNA